MIYQLKNMLGKHKGKQFVSYPCRPKTRPTNKMRLNSKALFKPSLKEEKIINIDYDIPEKTPKITKKERLAIKTLRKMPIRKTRKEK
jgi:hypothetical protein